MESSVCQRAQLCVLGGIPLQGLSALQGSNGEQLGMRGRGACPSGSCLGAREREREVCRGDGWLAGWVDFTV